MENTLSTASDEGCTRRTHLHALAQQMPSVHQLFWHNSLVLEVAYYANKNASIMWKSQS